MRILDHLNRRPIARGALDTRPFKRMDDTKQSQSMLSPFNQNEENIGCRSYFPLTKRCGGHLDAKLEFLGCRKCYRHTLRYTARSRLDRFSTTTRVSCGTRVIGLTWNDMNYRWISFLICRYVNMPCTDDQNSMFFRSIYPAEYIQR